MPSPPPRAALVNLNTPYAKRKLSDTERRAIYEKLLSRSTDGELPHGAYANTARLFNCNWRSVSRIWARGRKSSQQGNVDAKFKGKSGSKRKYTTSDIERAVKALPIQARQTLRTMAAQSGVAKTTLVRHMAEEKRLKAKSSYSKPLLTDENARGRMEHALSLLQQSPNRTTFSKMHQYVHIDEKWFFLTTVRK
ncbi:hypothetical protein H257_18817 [Aphanomyces astaci]|uniref:DUF7769 domain-containing protein n=1 Tax=Aphanomyces astaci TaxID=112090 RepID=W4FBT3_APHAT|nr:hypothetical protein H257_18817 [Aphanomyces astaci]ETV64271.1 hypothetical protein H257_18817 [Aphanomyces astaci]|eukprot:XP_009846245.1 hypothetical protein H257_18817 [Aphanomyces astaci]